MKLKHSDCICVAMLFKTQNIMRPRTLKNLFYFAIICLVFALISFYWAINELLKLKG